MSGKNSNWTEDKNGYHKSESSSTKGNADYFARPIPPVRDSANRPLVPNGGGRIDVARWVQEINDHDQ